jgi:hypothetical protein
LSKKIFENKKTKDKALINYVNALGVALVLVARFRVASLVRMEQRYFEVHTITALDDVDLILRSHRRSHLRNAHRANRFE